MRPVKNPVRRLFRRMRCEEGGSLVEMALACTIFLAMLLAVFQGLLASYIAHYVSDAAREGSRYAAVRGSTSCTNTPSLANCNATSDQVQSYVRGLGYPGVQRGLLTVTATWLAASSGQPTTWSACTGKCNAPGNQVQVVAVYAFPLAIPFVSSLSFNLTSTSTMVISQ